MSQEAITNVVDIALLTIKDKALHVALVVRENPDEPAHGQLALPGGFIRTELDKDVWASAERVLYTKAGITPDLAYLEQLGVFSGVNRDPVRNWSLSVAFWAVAPFSNLLPAIESGSIQLVEELGKIRTLPFDHKEIIRTAVERVKVKTEYSTLPVRLCEPEFTFRQLLTVYDVILGKANGKGRNEASLRRKLKEMAAIEPVDGKFAQLGRSAPAQIYRASAANGLLTRQRGL